MNVLKVLAFVAVLCLAIAVAIVPLELKRRKAEREALDRAHEEYRRDLEQSRRHG